MTRAVGSGVVPFNSITDEDNGTLVAKPARQNWTIIVEWEAGVPFYDTTGHRPMGRRLYFRVEIRTFLLDPEAAHLV